MKEGERQLQVVIKLKNETYQLETYVEGDGEEHEREKKL